MNKGLIYIHGKNGSAAEAEHYRDIFPECDVVGFDYHSDTPWDARNEFCRFFDAFSMEHSAIGLIANSIGAFFSMNALYDRNIERAYFISPIVNMEKLIEDMIRWAGTTEQELMKMGTIETGFGETLSREYLTWVRNHPIVWRVPTKILYGEKDQLQSIETIRDFADRYSAKITVMLGGEHWFHTEEQMRFLDTWIKE